MTMVVPAFAMPVSMSITASPFDVSRFPVGSSASMQLRVGHQRTRNRDALLLTAGELLRHVPRAMSKRDAFQRRRHPLATLGARARRDKAAQRSTFSATVEIVDEIEALKDETHASATM